MNPSSIKPSSLKISLIFTGSILVLNLLLDLIAAFFKLDYFLRWDYFLYEIVLEALVGFISSFGTASFTSKLPDFSFKTILIRIVVFAILYTLFALLLELIIYLSILGTDMHLYHPNFRLVISGIKESFVFIVIWMVLKYRQKD